MIYWFLLMVPHWLPWEDIFVRDTNILQLFCLHKQWKQIDKVSLLYVLPINQSIRKFL